MSKKTTSDQDNKVSLISELKKEFGGQMRTFLLKRDQFIQRYPKQLFVTMVAAILVSGFLAFSVMRRARAEHLPSVNQFGNGVSGGIGEIVHSSQLLREVLELQKQINVILRKDSLDAADSLRVKEAITRLESIHSKLVDIKK